MNVSDCHELKQKIFDHGREEFGEVRTFTHPKKGSKEKGASISIQRRPSFLSLGVARQGKANKSARLAVRVAKGKGNYQRARKLLSKAGVKMADVDLVSGVEYTAYGRILQIATTGAHPQLCRGTFGAIVEDNDHLYILSCNHVLTNMQTASKGDPIVQPSACDSDELNAVGHLCWWEPLNAGTIDVALATIDGSIVSRIDALQIPTETGTVTMDPNPIADRMDAHSVFKTGARTGYTEGKIVTVDIDNVPVTYVKPDGSSFTVHFDNQIEIEHVNSKKVFSKPGDSGALIIDKSSNRPYALLFSGMTGNDGIPKTLASFLPDVLKAANVRLVTEAHPAIPKP